MACITENFREELALRPAGPRGLGGGCLRDLLPSVSPLSFLRSQLHSQACSSLVVTRGPPGSTRHKSRQLGTQWKESMSSRKLGRKSRDSLSVPQRDVLLLLPGLGHVRTGARRRLAFPHLATRSKNKRQRRFLKRTVGERVPSGGGGWWGGRAWATPAVGAAPRHICRL